MNSLPIGLLVLGGALAYALADSNIATFFNTHSIVLVLVGTLGVFALSTPSGDIRGLFQCLAALWRREHELKDLNAAIIALSKKRDAQVTAKHPLIRYARELWVEGVEQGIFALLLHQRATHRVAAAARAMNPKRY